MTTATDLATSAPAILRDVLVAIADHDGWQDIDRTQAVSIRRVLATAWAPYRLERSAARLAAGERAPAINATRYILNGEGWYIPSDGNHRTVAAREAGKRTIRCRIAGEVVCEPDACYLDVATGRLWRHVGHGSSDGRAVLTLLADGFDGEKGAAALALGVNDLAKGVHWRLPT